MNFQEEQWDRGKADNRTGNTEKWKIKRKIIEETLFQMKEDMHLHKNDRLYIKQNDWKNICVHEIL